MSTVKVRAVGGRRDVDAFIRLPFRLHRGTPWVPPLIAERRDFLNRDKNPFFDQGEAEYFVAERRGEVVGRISAQTDERWTKHNGGNDGMFGFFDCEPSPETASALVEAASGWLRERGRERMIGPMDFTTNDECGLLVEGFELAPFVLEPWHPHYYRDLLEGLGMSKAMDLLMWKLELGQLKQGDRFHELIHQAAEASATEHGVVIRHMRKRDLEAEVERFMEVYNEAWDRNWGFVPVTEEEVRFQVKNLKPILDENWAMIAERGDEVVGAALTLPDINQVLRKMNGRLLPFGWLRFLAGRRKVDRVRVFALGVKPSCQHLGVAAALYVEHIEMAAKVRQKWGEMGWILETNEPMNRAMEGMGGTVVKRYRLYELPFTGPPATASIPQNSGKDRWLTAQAAYTLAAMAEEAVLEAEAVEEPASVDEGELQQATRLPEPTRRTEVEAWRGEVRTAAIAAAGGLVAGAATVAAVRAVRSQSAPRRQRARRRLRRRDERQSVIASRSFLVDVHILGNDR